MQTRMLAEAEINAGAVARYAARLTGEDETAAYFAAIAARRAITDKAAARAVDAANAAAIRAHDAAGRAESAARRAAALA